MKRKYFIENIGCDDTTSFVFELTENELELIIKLFDSNNRKVEEYCQPELYIFDLDDFGKPLNKEFLELKRKVGKK